MVVRGLVGFSLAALCLSSGVGAPTAQAQFVRDRVGGGVVIRAPFVPRIVVGPRPVIRPVVPLVRPVAPLVRPVVPLVSPRRIVGGAVIARAPLAGGVVRAGVAAPNFRGVEVFASPVVPAAASVARASQVAEPAAMSEEAFPSEADLQSLDDGGLLNALLDLTGRLDGDLARFNTGAQWRSFLQLPADAVPAPTNNQVVLGMSSLKTTLGRFDKIAGDSAYRSINGLGSFVASHAALAEVVARFGSRQAPPATPPQVPPQTPPQLPPQSQASPSSGVIQAAAQEELPSPGPALDAPPTSARDGERSILSR